MSGVVPWRPPSSPTLHDGAIGAAVLKPLTGNVEPREGAVSAEGFHHRATLAIVDVRGTEAESLQGAARVGQVGADNRGRFIDLHFPPYIWTMCNRCYELVKSVFSSRNR